MDSFRIPKELLLRLNALLLIFAAIVNYSSPTPVRILPRGALLRIVVLLIVWSSITTLTSTNRTLSLDSLFWLLTATTYFIAAGCTARQMKTMHLAAWGLVPGVLNSLVALFQLLQSRKRLDSGVVTGLAGNTNDLASLLVPSILAATVLALVGGSGRWLPLTAIPILIAGLVASHGTTALIAVSAGLIPLMFALKRRSVALLTLLMAAVIATVFLVSPSLRQKARAIPEALRNPSADQRLWNLDVMLSYRITPFLSAWQMFQDRPLVGVGPGCFAWEYYRYRLMAQESHPALLESITQNFGEAHSDHLQVLAETGAPGYLLFVASIVFLARVTTVRRGGRDQRANDLCRRFAGTLALPLALSFAVLTLAQFPLRLAAPTVIYLFYAAVCLEWAPPETSLDR